MYEFQAFLISQATFIKAFFSFGALFLILIIYEFFVRCKIGKHNWDGTYFSLFSKDTNRSCKCWNCNITRHDWDACTCRRCGEQRDQFHDWDGCSCKRCNKKRDEQHSWDGCLCKKCNKTRNEQHTWDGCQCETCKRNRDEQHTWDGCLCKKCKKYRNEQHDWDGCKCKKCNAINIELQCKNNSHHWILTGTTTDTETKNYREIINWFEYIKTAYETYHVDIYQCKKCKLTKEVQGRLIDSDL